MTSSLFRIAILIAILIAIAIAIVIGTYKKLFDVRCECSRRSRCRYVRVLLAGRKRD